MAGPSETLNALNKILSQLQKMGDSTAKAVESQRQKTSSKRGGNRSFIDYGRAIDNLEKDTTKLDKTFKSSQKTLEKSTKTVSQSLLALAKDALTPARTMKQAMKEWKESLDTIVKVQNADYQRLAKNTRDYVHTNKTAGVTNIRNANNAFKDSMNILRNISRNHGKISTEDARLFKESRNRMTDALKGGNLRVLQNVSKKQVELFDKVSKGGKLTVAQLKELTLAAEKVNKNFNVMNDVTETYTKNYTEMVKVFRESLLNAVKGIGAGISQILSSAVPQVYKDVMAQAQNAVQSSQYFDIQKFHMGISQAELAQFIGSNRLALRTLGGGSSTTPFANGQINQLQNQAHNFGLTGEDALKYVGSTFDDLIRMGLTPTVKNTSQAMDVLYKTMQETGMSFGELNGMVEDLSKSPAFTELIRANGYKGQADQIEILGKLLTTSRYSSGYLKEMLEINKQAKFQGIAEMIKGQVGISLTSNLLRRYGGNVSPIDEALAQMENRGMEAPQITELIKQGKLDRFKINGKKASQAFQDPRELEQYVLGLGGRYNEARLAVNNRMAAAGGGMGMGLFNTMFGQYSGLMGNMQKIFNPDEAIQAQAQRQALFGTINPTIEQQKALLGANDQLITSINDVDNALEKLSGMMPDTIAKIKEAAEGAQKNPGVGVGGATASGLLKFGKGALELGGISGGLLTLKSALGSKIGWLGRGAQAVGGLFGSSAIPAALSAGASTVGAIGAGAAAGGLIGTGINKAPELFGGQDLSTYIGQWFAPKYDNSKIYPGYHSNKGIVNQNNPQQQISNNDNAITANTGLTPQGDTTGDLMSMSVDRLTELVKIGRDQLDLMQKIHQEHMDAMADQQNDKAIQDARNATLHSLAVSH